MFTQGYKTEIGLIFLLIILEMFYSFNHVHRC